jgi:6-phospho-beta-glucosidase
MMLSIVGGGAHSTPNLFAPHEWRRLADSFEVALIGRTSESLLAVARAISILHPDVYKRMLLATIHSPKYYDALRASNVILVQARYGGYAGRERDERFPLKFGIPGDEGLGPGGLSAAWRTWPELSKLLQDIRTTNPASLVVLLTSPVSLLTRCARQSYADLQTIGICELPWATLKEVCSVVGCDAEHVQFNYAGVNHLGWLYDVSDGGKDVVEAYAARRRSSMEFPNYELINRCAAIPLKYLRLHYESANTVADLRSKPSRGGVLAGIRSTALHTYAFGDADGIEAALQMRPTPWYIDAVVPLLAGLVGRPMRVPLFLSVENDGYVSALERDDIVEVAHGYAEGRLVRRHNESAPPPGVLQTLLDFVRYERVAARAVIDRDPALLRDALAIHPWVRVPAAVDDLARDVIAAV